MRFVEPGPLRACVHCGLCLASCPTYVALGAEADSPRGRIQLIGDLEAGALEPTADVRRHLDGCLGCRACETACPSGVPYGVLIEAARPFIEASRPLPLRLARRALGRVLTRPRLVGRLTRLLRPVAGTWVARRAAARTGQRLLAYLAALSIEPSPGPWPAIFEPRGQPRGTALLVAGCVADALFTRTNRMMAELLALAGVRVVVATGTCCGALALHLGDADHARGCATELLGHPGIGSVDWVVTTAAGCGALLREVGHLLPERSDAPTIGAKARDPLALLAECGLPPPIHRIRGRGRVAVHDPCHLAHGQGVREEIRTLLGSIPGVEIVPLAESDWCCGSAGTYNLTEPALAARLVARKTDRIIESGADIIVAANPGCLVQIRAELVRRGVEIGVEHPVELLARAYGAVGKP